MESVLEIGETSGLKASLVYLARRRFRITRDVADDLVQSALLTFIEVRHRYLNSEEHQRILVGIFRNKCREYIGRTVRAARGLGALRSSVQAGESGIAAAKAEPTPAAGVLSEIMHREDSRIILQALGRLRPQAREMFRLITEEGLSRKDLMQRFQVNANTLDSRLHTYRRELRALLDREGFRP